MAARRSWCTLLLALSTLGCRLPTANIELFESPPPPVFTEPPPSPRSTPAREITHWPCIPAGNRAPDESDPTTIPCPANISSAPVSYFKGTVSLRLPAGLNEDNFVEMTPDFVRLTSEVESVSCSEELPGAMIVYAALTVLADDPATPLVDLRDELLDALGYEQMSFCGDVLDVDRRGLESVFSVPPSGPNPEPAAAVLRLVAGEGLVVALVYEVHPQAWIVEHETLLASARSLMISSP